MSKIDSGLSKGQILARKLAGEKRELQSQMKNDFANNAALQELAQRLIAKSRKNK